MPGFDGRVPSVLDRLALSLINLCRYRQGLIKRIRRIWMDDDTRKGVLVTYQKRKQDEIMHP